MSHNCWLLSWLRFGARSSFHWIESRPTRANFVQTAFYYQIWKVQFWYTCTGP